jgi:EmrB/QacA subfamily drug resistance transporter
LAGIAYVGAVSLSAVDLQIVNVALPSIGASFGATLHDYQWVVVAYALSLAVVMPASGWVGDRFGTKRILLWALVGFIAASMGCGLAGNLAELVGARVIQGICGGLMTPAATALLYRAFPNEQRARVARLVIVPILLAPAVAPLLGGILISALSWRWVFFVNLPIGGLLALVIALNLEEYRQEKRGRLDGPALIGSAVGLTSLIYCISEGTTQGWGSLPIIASGVAGVLVLWWFARRQLRSRDPVLDLRLLDDRLFRASVITIGFSTASFMGMLYLAPIFLQEADHQSALSSGSITFVEAIGVLLTSQTLARLYPRLGPRVMATAGAIAVAVVLLWMTQGSAQTSLWIVRAQMFLLGAMNSLTLLSLQSSAFTNISHRRIGHASAIFVTQRQTAIALGIAILTSVATSSSGSGFHRFHLAFFAAAGLAACAAVAACALIHTSDARPSMGKSAGPDHAPSDAELGA